MKRLILFLAALSLAADFGYLAYAKGSRGGSGSRTTKSRGATGYKNKTAKSSKFKSPPQVKKMPGGKTKEVYKGTDGSRKTVIKDRSGRPVFSDTRDAKGNRTVRNMRTGSTTTIGKNGNVTKRFANGTQVSRKTIGNQRQTSRFSRGQSHSYTSSRRSFHGQPVYVHNYSSGLFDSPFFWLWLMSSNSSHSDHRGYYSGSGGGQYQSGQVSQAQANLPKKDIVYDWRENFSDLGSETITEKAYPAGKNQAEHIVQDYVAFEIKNDFSRKKSEKDSSSDEDENVHSSEAISFSLGHNEITVLQSQTSFLLGKMLNRETVTLENFLGDEAVNARTFVLEETVELKNMVTQDICTLNAGDSLTLTEYVESVQMVSFHVESAEPIDGGNTCGSSTNVYGTAEIAQSLVNSLMQRVERGLTFATKLATQ